MSPIKKHTETHHGKTLSDYHWLKDQNYPTVEDVQILDYLKAENGYYYEFLEPHRELVDAIFEGLNLKDEPTRVIHQCPIPIMDNGYEYRRYFEPEHRR